ncbi:ChrR family anti-sigma-E factor [Hyphomonas sp.]|jgi:putative transcriptional regulator|uniref:ChrR family anti-sigma-E factor n=1 Tax=Hyphomonas sp. TaxID=87 RepID=UPI0039E572B5
MTRQNDFPFSELFSAYAAGTLDAGLALLVETQGALRADIKDAVAQSEAVAGAYLEMTEPVAMCAGALESAMAQFDALEASATTEQAGGPVEDGEMGQLPAPLQHAIAASRNRETWSSAAPGIHRIALDVGSQMEVELYRIQPDGAIPRHSHGGEEYTLVVTGGYTDASGSFGPGDLAVKGPEDTHRPVGDAGEVCFALVVRDGAFRLTGALGLAQRILGRR